MTARRSTNRPPAPAPSKTLTPAATGTPPITHGSSPVLWGVCAALVLLVFLAFGQSAQYGFLNWDDIIYIRDYPEVKAGLSLKGFVWAWTHPHYSNWHPLTTLSFMFDSSVFGSNGAGFHQHNLVLHAITVVLFFLALRKFTDSTWRSAFATALFAIHPLRVESVAWITERKDVLSGLFLMATLLAYAAYAKKPSKGRYAAVFLLFACGLLSKSVLVTVPALLLLLDVWPLQRLPLSAPAGSLLGRAWPLLREKIPLILLSAGSCVATILSVDLHRPMSPPPFLARLAYIPVWCVTYVRQFFFPVDLSAHYPYVQAGPLPSIALGCLLILGAISVLCWFYRNSLPVLLVAWAWFFIALLPVIGIVPPGIQLMADRYTYVAQIGMAIAVAWGGHHLTASWSRKWMAPTLAGLIVAGLAALSFQQTRYWKSDEALWQHTVAVTHENDFGNGQLGDSLAVAGKLNEAEPYYREALRLNPNLAGVLNNLALVKRNQGNLAESESLLKRATIVSPWFSGARNDLAAVQIAQNRMAEARQTIEETVKLEPNNFDAVYRLGVILSEGDPAKADYPRSIEYLTHAAQLQPGNAQIFFSLGNAYFLSGKIPESVASFQAALQRDPKHSRAANNLGTILARANRLPESIAAYRHAIQADPSYLDAYDGLADVLIRAKKADEAVQVWQAALRQNAQDIRAHYKLSWLLATYPESGIRNGREAETLARRGIELNGGKEGLLYDALGAACAEQGRFDEAIENATKAVELVSAANNTVARDTIQLRLEGYKNQKPFRTGN
jgi:tetratricopeptide (TPR) repeat protein